MMKFALFLVCALVAVQGFQARSVAPAERDLNDIIETIKAVIEKIKQIISEVTSQIPEIIQNIKDKINEIVGKLPGIIEAIKKKIEELIQHAGEVGRKCVDAQREEIENLVALAQNGIQGCVAEAESKTEALREQLEVLVGQVSALRDDVINRTLKCVDENKLNPVGLVKCLREQVGPVADQIGEIQQEVVNTIAVAKQTAQEAGTALVECSNRVQGEVAAKEAEILNAIKDCITSSS